MYYAYVKIIIQYIAHHKTDTVSWLMSELRWRRVMNFMGSSHVRLTQSCVTSAKLLECVKASLEAITVGGTQTWFSTLCRLIPQINFYPLRGENTYEELNYVYDLCMVIENLKNSIFFTVTK